MVRKYLYYRPANLFFNLGSWGSSINLSSLDRYISGIIRFVSSRIFEYTILFEYIVLYELEKSIFFLVKDSIYEKDLYKIAK